MSAIISQIGRRAPCFSASDSKGAEFKVGCDCVRKTGDAGMKKVVDKMVKAAQDARKKERIVAAFRALPSLEGQLRALPHPKAQAWGGTTLTLWDWTEWMMKHAGTTGKLEVAKVVEKLLKAAK